MFHTFILIKWIIIKGIIIANTQIVILLTWTWVNGIMLLLPKGLPSGPIITGPIPFSPGIVRPPWPIIGIIGIPLTVCIAIEPYGMPPCWGSYPFMGPSGSLRRELYCKGQRIAWIARSLCSTTFTKHTTWITQSLCSTNFTKKMFFHMIIWNLGSRNKSQDKCSSLIYRRLVFFLSFHFCQNFSVKPFIFVKPFQSNLFFQLMGFTVRVF